MKSRPNHHVGYTQCRTRAERRTRHNSESLSKGRDDDVTGHSNAEEGSGLHIEATRQLPRGRGRKHTGRPSPWQASTREGRTEAPRPGAPAGSGPYPRESTGDQINTQKRRGSHRTNKEHASVSASI